MPRGKEVKQMTKEAEDAAWKAYHEATAPALEAYQKAISSGRQAKA
jgi:hypothetical protein